MNKIGVLILFLLFVSTAQAQQGAQQFEKFYLQGINDTGGKAWDIRGDSAKIEGNIIYISKVDANRYGEQEVNIKSDRGQMNKDNGNVRLEEHVVISAKEGGQLKTDHLDWNKNDDLVLTDAPVKITEPNQGMTATGVGLKAKTGLKTAEMQKDVTVTMSPKSDLQKPEPIQTVTITCDGPMEIDQKINKAVFRKNVVAVEADRTLKSDLMEVYFNPETKRIKQAICTGHVEMIQGGNSTFSEKAVFNGEDQTLVLTGRPKLIMQTGDQGAMPAFNKKK